MADLAIPGTGVMVDSARAAARARNLCHDLLPRGEDELWEQASQAIDGEYPKEIAERAHRFWDEVDGS